MSDRIDALRKLYATEKERIFHDFFNFLRIPSISTDPHFAADVLRCSNWVEEYLKNSGLQVERWEGEGHPTLFASWDGAGPDKPTILIYGHYDVQPVDPLELWKSPPFEPEVRDGEVYARGALDDKGQIFYAMAAVRTMLRADGNLPVNLKFLIEGEEETSSQLLNRLLPEKRNELTADSLIVIDVGFAEIDKPAVVLGARGICALEVILTGSNTDLHSGTNGGIVYNPNRALVELLSKAVDKEGRVAIPGFYDSVKNLSEDDRARLRLEFNAEWYEKLFAAKATGGEKAFTPAERAWIRPTFEINGVAGGYYGDGFKTVIPARAIAKISCRLVPDQTPEEIFERVKAFLEANAPKEMTIEVKSLGGGKAARSNPNSIVVRAAAQAYSEVNDTSCAFTLEGGSLPIVSALMEAAGSEMVLIGYGLPGDLMHAPNEHFGVERMEKGFVTVARLLQILGESHDRA